VLRVIGEGGRGRVGVGLLRMTTPPTSPATADPGIDAALAAVSAQRMADTVASLAGDRFAGRRAGTPGGAAARSWLAGQLAGLGAVGTDEFSVRSVPEVYTAPRVWWHDGHGERQLVFGRQVGVPLASADTPVRRTTLLDRAGRHTGLPLVAGPVASDNRRYAAAGLPAVGIGAGMGGYHSPADTADRVDLATLAAVCRLVGGHGLARRHVDR
jgi:hypothetical protein